MSKSLMAMAALSAAMLALPAAAGTMSAADLVKARFDTFNRHDLDGVTALYAPDAVLTSPGFCHDRTGIAGARQAYSDLFKAVPDIQDQVKMVVIDGDHVAIQFVVRSARGGFEAPLANFLTLEHGLIKRDEAYYDPKGQPCT